MISFIPPSSGGGKCPFSFCLIYTSKQNIKGDPDTLVAVGCSCYVLLLSFTELFPSRSRSGAFNGTHSLLRPSRCQLDLTATLRSFNMLLYFSVLCAASFQTMLIVIA